MSQGITERMKKDGIVLFIFAAWLIVFAATFYKDSVIANITIAGSLFLFFVLPPYAYYLAKHETRHKMLFFYCCMYAAIAVLASYYLGIIGVNVKYHPWLLTIAALTYPVYKILNEEKNQ